MHAKVVDGTGNKLVLYEASYPHWDSLQASREDRKQGVSDVDQASDEVCFEKD